MELSLAVIVHPDEIIIVSIGAIRSEKVLWKARMVDAARTRFDLQNLYAGDSILGRGHFAFLKLVLLAFTVLYDCYTTTECCKNKAERFLIKSVQYSTVHAKVRVLAQVFERQSRARRVVLNDLFWARYRYFCTLFFPSIQLSKNTSIKVFMLYSYTVIVDSP